MSKEKQIEEMADDLLDCHTEFGSGVGEIYTDYNTTAQKMFAKGYRKQSEWISVHDRLPALGENVLCFENGKFYIAFFEKFEEGAWWDWVAYDRDDTWNEVCPSYWTPLPPPPKGD